MAMATEEDGDVILGEISLGKQEYWEVAWAGEKKGKSSYKEHSI